MVDDDTAILQHEDEWDFEAGETQRAPRGRRSIVSVGFKSDEFEAVTAAARNSSQPLSQYIRAAAVEKALGPRVTAPAYIQIDGGMISAFSVAELHSAASRRYRRMRAVS